MYEMSMEYYCRCTIFPLYTVISLLLFYICSDYINKEQQSTHAAATDVNERKGGRGRKRKQEMKDWRGVKERREEEEREGGEGGGGVYAAKVRQKKRGVGET